MCSNVQIAWDKVNSRPLGDVEVLIGSNFLGLHPIDIETQGNLKMKRSKFSSGFVLSGSHPSLELSDSHNATPHSVNGSICATNLQYRSIREYLDSKELEVETPRRCNNCVSCKDCTYQGHQMSLRKQFENKIMEDNVSYDEAEKVFHVKYQFVEDPSILTCNIGQAIRIAECVKKNVIKEGLLAKVNSKFDMINYGALVELSD